MANTCQPGPLVCTAIEVTPPRTPGPLGWLDRADPNYLSLTGDQPGPAGQFAAVPPRVTSSETHAPELRQQTRPGHAAPPQSSTSSDAWKPLESGAASLVKGASYASVARIPVPGTNGLFIELSPPKSFKGNSTSAFFIQDVTGRRHLRLDYGFNVKSGRVDYHWNQKGTFQQFKITDHAPAGRAGAALYRSAVVFKVLGRTLLVLAVASDMYSIVVAEKKIRQVLRVGAGWTCATVACAKVGAAGATVGSAVPGVGTAVVGLASCAIAGGIAYWACSEATGAVYDFVEEIAYPAVLGRPVEVTG